MYLNNVVDIINNQLGGGGASTVLKVVGGILAVLYFISPALFTGLIMSGQIKTDSEGNPKGPKGKYITRGKVGIIGTCVTFYLTFIAYFVFWLRKGDEGNKLISRVICGMFSLMFFILWCLVAAQVLAAPDDEEAEEKKEEKEEKEEKKDN